MNYQSQNPATGRIVRSFPEITAAEFEEKIAVAAGCYESWRHRTCAERAVIVSRAATILAGRIDEFDSRQLVRTAHMEALV